ncbi:MAG: hypothetical protein B7O98_04535 [Zestosphaera tikiterensis]|uniref:DUF4350 domain-containing protein n=1 Tax=Zestosphaera tikiterensis TaxID=1973259 RepID=A0A2R7Y840_9CREN|nr:MAG: hypothetical protein B7O98_04535 [Zestosphaera tikiterensis]
MKKLKLVSSWVVIGLVVLALIALLEKGPPIAYVFSGASPASPMSFGTYEFYLLVRERHQATAVFRLDDLKLPSNSRCVYVLISPDIPYTLEEGRHVAKALSQCVSYAALIADEWGTSNNVLIALNTSVRVVGDLVLDALRTPYPQAQMRVIGRYENTYEITLDIASEVSGGTPSGFVVNGYVVTGGNAPPIKRDVIYVAAYESVKDNPVYVIGDGSIFLNQVLTSKEGGRYREFALSVVEGLCGGQPNCYVVFDGSHHSGVKASDLLARPQLISNYVKNPQDLFYVITPMISLILHPTFWLPPLASWLNRFTGFIFGNELFYSSALLFAVVLTYYLVKGRFPSTSDFRLPEQSEVELFATSDIRNAVLAGRVKLGKEDFIKLYDMVNSVLVGVAGVELSDEKALQLLSKAVGAEASLKYFKEMNKLYVKVKKRKLLPIVLSWDRRVRKLITQSEEVLKALGTSLQSERGVEYVFLRFAR